ncbi:MAG: hypothetical protein FPO08_12910 [Geobacter sp.]|nr:MAG: hypothetical protein FPO08_12910 [Geobacter sp.]
MFVAAALGNCSFTELKEVSQYEDLTLSDAISELKSLFLLSSPSIINEVRRFEVPKITALLVFENIAEICSEHNIITKRIKDYTSSIKYTATSSKIAEVGKAIYQGNALMRAGDLNSAIKTIDVLLQKDKYKKNPDLLLAKGRYSLELDRPDLNSARNLFQKAYACGLRKEILFHLWYRAESLAKHHPGIIEVCTYAIENELSDAKWYFRRAQGYSLAASCVNQIDAINYYKKACQDLYIAIKTSKGDERTTLHNLTHEIYDRMCHLAKTLPDKSTETIFDLSLFCVRLSDTRPLLFNRMIDCVEKLLEQASEDSFLSPGRREQKNKSASTFILKIEQEFNKLSEKSKASYFERVSNRLREVRGALENTNQGDVVNILTPD